MFFCLPAFKYWLAEQWDFTYSTGLRVTVHRFAVVLVFLKDQPPTHSQEVSCLRTGLVIWFLASTPAMRTPLQDPVTGISSAVWASQLLYNIWLFISLGYEIKAYKQWKGAVKGSHSLSCSELSVPLSLYLDLSLLCYCIHPPHFSLV